MTTTKTTEQVLSDIYEGCRATMDYLFGRWLDEQKYEDIVDYAIPFADVLKPFGVVVVRMTKRPFGVIFTLNGGTYHLRRTMKTYELRLAV